MSASSKLICKTIIYLNHGDMNEGTGCIFFVAFADMFLDIRSFLITME